MRLSACVMTVCMSLALSGAAFAAQALSAPSVQPASAPTTKASPDQPEALRALDGEWIFLEDRTEGRTLEQMGPPMASKMSMRVEEGAVILNGHGSGHRDVRIALDGSVTQVNDANSVARYRGSWKDGEFAYSVEFLRGPELTPGGMIRRSFRHTPEGLIVRVAPRPSDESWWVGLYRHAEDIPMPTPAKATIADMAWLAGAWVGTRGEGGAISIEERWSPPLGGAMLAVSRSVRNGRMGAFEYLRIVERDGGLVYAAQPGGAKATEFVLTELTAKRAVFDNPRHDYPKRIVYELSAEGGLTATTGQLKGGTPRRLEFKREAN